MLVLLALLGVRFGIRNSAVGESLSNSNLEFVKIVVLFEFFQLFRTIIVLIYIKMNI